MQLEVGLRFNVRSSSGNVETFLVDADYALIGAAAHCEVRLAPEDAEHEHVEVVATQNTVQITTRSAVTPPLLDGVPFVAGPWPGNATLQVGQAQITVELVDLGPTKRGRSPLWVLLSVPVVAILAVLVAARSAPAAEAVIPPAPPLLDPPSMTCPSTSGATLTAFAAERTRIGLAKRERSPFSPADGIEAVGLLETAAACYRMASMPDAERDVGGAARALRARLEEEYHVRRIRAEHAFKVGDPFGAKRELDVLLPMTAHRRGPYIDWLASLQRYATTAVDDRGSRRL